MSAVDLVVIMLVAIGSAIVAVLATVWVSSLVRAHRVRIEPTLGEARHAIVAALSGGSQQSDDALAHLSRFSRRYVASLMLDLAPSVSGSSRAVLVSLGEQIGIIDRARTGVGSQRWSTRLYSARVLTAFGVDCPRMYALLIDRSPEVRAQAAAWCVAVQNPLGIENLILLLGDTDGQCRFAAQDSLIRIGLPASEALISALGTSDEDVKARILEIAAAMGDDRYFDKARGLLADPSPSTRALAAALLASTGSRSAGPALVAMLDDPSDEVVLAAAAGLGKLGFWSGAAAVELLLTHPAWELRKQAGMTLLALGAPGSILLRAGAAGVGPAAEMAMQSLQLQSLSIQEEAA
jgi:HEAT repeat protein